MDGQTPVADDVLAERHAAEMFEQHGLWMPHDGQSAFHWRSRGFGSSVVVDGLILFGEITAERLHGLRLTGDQGPAWNPIAERFSTTFPPSEQHLRDYAAARQEAEDLEPHGALFDALVAWEPRKPKESPDDFYRRVASVYTALQRTNRGKPTSALAEVADVKFTTAVHWVREARKRGYLDLSRRQRTARGES